MNFAQYNCAPIFQILGTLVTTAQVVLIAICALGPVSLYQSWTFEKAKARAEQLRERLSRNPDTPYRAVPVPHSPQDIRAPNWVQDLEDKRWFIAAGAWFGGQILKQVFTKTDAFEIFLGRTQIFSKIQTGRMPDLEELRKKIKEQLG